MFSLPALISGALVGFILGLVGGGGSILATPLLLYVVGVTSPHVAIGTGAIAVAANALLNVVSYWRRGWVRWRPALAFAVLGVVGAVVGSTLGKIVPGDTLLVGFALVMFAVGATMLLPERRPVAGTVDQRAPWLLPTLGLGTGFASGFFGIGGGFLIIPSLLVSTGMPMIEAIGSSLVSVSAFGLATGANYALTGLVDWGIALQFVAGGLAGGLMGSGLAARLSDSKRVLRTIFAVGILLAAVYVLVRALASLMAGAA